MRSGDGAERPTTLVRRLTRTLVIACALAAVSATIASLALADTLIRARVQRAVEAEVGVLAVEIDEKPSLLDEGLLDEARELGIEDPIAIVPTEPGEGCRREGPEFVCRRALAGAPGRSASVAVPVGRMVDHRQPLLLAGLGVLVIVVLGSALLARRLARRLLAPLERLREVVGTIDVSAPKAVALPSSSSFDELDALREAIASLLARLDEELARVRRFSSAAAHELRTPLTKMHAELELALEASEPAAARATFERLARTTDHLVALSERLLLIATPLDALASNSGASMAALIEGLVERRSPADAARLTIEVGEGDGLVRGDELLLASMIDNVVDNALKFSSGPVRVGMREVGDEIVITVDDEGPGVSPELAAELFEPFRRAIEARGRPGHGLGLALVSHLARAHGGRVGFVEGRSKGARVELRLPRASSD